MWFLARTHNLELCDWKHYMLFILYEVGLPDEQVETSAESVSRRTSPNSSDFPEGLRGWRSREKLSMQLMTELKTIHQLI